jgi:organizing structure protein 2
LLSDQKSIYDDDNSSSELAPLPGSTKPVERSANHKDDEIIPGIKNQTVDGVKVKTSEVLEKNVSTARKWLVEQSKEVQDQLDAGLQKYLHVERRVSSTVADLKSEHEDMLPGSIYVLISALSGSIFARRRNVLVRFAAPVVFGVAAFKYFLPHTFTNTAGFIWRLEQRSPAIADTHLKVQSQINSLAAGVSNVAEQGEKQLETGVHKTRQFIASTTGLQLPEESKKDDKKKGN